MQKRTREIIALVLLVVLGVAVLCAMGWYILVGHNWNVTASNIDDSIGQMKGYTVFLVKGNKEIPSVQTGEDAAVAEGMTADGVRSDDPSVTVVDEGSQANEQQATSAGGPDATSSVTEDATEVIPRTLHELIMEYQDKGAEVYVIESTDEKSYAKPALLGTMDFSIGVFKVNDPARPAAVKVDAKLLDRMNTDFNILVTSDTNLEGSVLKDVDIIVFNSSDTPHSNSRYGGNTYCVDTPFIGQIEAIIMSPSGVISSKVIDL